MDIPNFYSRMFSGFLRNMMPFVIMVLIISVLISSVVGQIKQQISVRNGGDMSLNFLPNMNQDQPIYPCRDDQGVCFFLNGNMLMSGTCEAEFEACK